MKRHTANPIITRHDIPDIAPNVIDVSSVFNPGAVMFEGREMLLLRVQTRGRRTVLIVAERTRSGDYKVYPEVVEIEGLKSVSETIYHVYDPRLTAIEGTVYVMFAADVDDACRLGLAKTQDFHRFELVGFDDTQDIRNGVLFPEKIDGRYVRHDRPNRTQLPDGVTSGSAIELSTSMDLLRWTPLGEVMAGRPHYWDERIGSGPPPIKTHEGWLHVYHGIATHFASVNIYQAGVALLDLEHPLRVIARGGSNILEPRELYETVGQVPNVVFPSGIIVCDTDTDGFAKPDSEVRVYYGAADTVVGLAETTVADLLQACHTV